MDVERLLGPSEKGGNTPLLHVLEHTAIKKWRLSTDGCVNGSIPTEIPGWKWADMNRHEIYEFRRLLSLLNPRVKFRIADLPKDIFFVNGDGVVEEDFGRMDFDRLSAWVE